MQHATISLIGLLRADSTVLDNFHIPEGLDKSTLFDEIIMECSEMEIVYPEPEFFKTAVGIWSMGQLANWEKLWKMYSLEYNPIENYDRYEDSHDYGVNKDNEVTNGSRGGGTKQTSAKNNTNTSTDTETRNMKDENTYTSHQEYDNTSQVKAFNESSWADREHNNGTTDENGKNTLEMTGTDKHKIDGSGDELTTTSTTQNESTNGNTDRNATNDLWRWGHTHGNIGVTTTQQMMEQELAFWGEKFNIYDFICREFKERFCILIY